MLFDQLMARAEKCSAYIVANTASGTAASGGSIVQVVNIPSPEHVVYNAAIRLGREASVEELLGNIGRYCKNRRLCSTSRCTWTHVDASSLRQQPGGILCGVVVNLCVLRVRVLIFFFDTGIRVCSVDWMSEFVGTLIFGVCFSAF